AEVNHRPRRQRPSKGDQKVRKSPGWVHQSMPLVSPSLVGATNVCPLKHRTRATWTSYSAISPASSRHCTAL
ncbi:hypothetical protein NDU88_003587, partial [Pleurodeles waltl]